MIFYYKILVTKDKEGIFFFNNIEYCILFYFPLYFICMTLLELCKYFDSFLHIDDFPSDPSDNGLQVQNRDPAGKQIKKVAFAVDACQESIDKAIAENADVLVCEGMFGETDKLDRALETSHMLMQEAAEIAKVAGAGKLIFTHYSPSVQNPEEYIPSVREIFVDSYAGYDGFSESLKFKD